MNILRNFSRVLANNGFRFSILLLAVACTLLALAGSPQTVKKTLRDSDIYTALADKVADRASQPDSEGKPGHQDGDGQAKAEDAVLSQPEVKAAAKEALSPAFLQSSTEQVVDGTYRWLDGTVTEPDFKVDLQPAITTFENKAADAAVTRLQGLPACTLEQLRALNPNDIDPFQIPCLPPGINLTTERQKYIDSIASKSDNEFLKNPVLTAAQLKENNGGKSVFERLSAAPQAFQWLKRSPFILGIVALACIPAVILLYRDRRRGIRSLAFSLVGTGVVLLIISLFAGWLFSHYVTAANGPLHLADGNELGQAGVKLTDNLQRTAGKVLVTFGAAYTVIGAATLIILRVIKHNESRRDKQGTILDDRHDDYQGHHSQLETMANDAQAERDSATPKTASKPAAPKSGKPPKSRLKIQG